VSKSLYDGLFEFPVINPTYEFPNKLIRFSKAISSKDYDQWIHFYEDDYLFERVWKNPDKYLPVLKRFNGVILPDFSLYRDMPFCMQLWNIYRSRAIGRWLQDNNIKIIPNIRYADFRTYNVCCDGISSSCVISIGSYGTIKNLADRELFIKGLDHIVSRLKPMGIVLYGSAPDYIFSRFVERGIIIRAFQSDYAISRKKEIA
jgi:hypothetical protein